MLQQPTVGARAGAAVAYDSVRNQLVVSGGTQDFTAATWLRSSVGWSNVDSPLVGARVGARMVFDTARQRAVMFGGAVGTSVTSDLLEWDGTSWTRRSGVGPTPNHYVGLAYDSGRGRTVLFDGRTWEWDGTSWSLRTTSGPVSRAGSALAYDPVRQRTVLFGGNVDPEAFAGTRDTWEWDGTVWRQITTLGPSARAYTAMAFSPTSGKIVMFGGASGVMSNANLADTWEFDGTTWTQRVSSNVGGRSHHSLAWDTQRQRIVMFGGQTPSGASGDLWSWDGSAWTLIDAGPPGSYVVGKLVYDPVRDETLYYGGTNPTTLAALGETWTYGGSRWRQRQPANSPPPRHAPALAWDAQRQRVLLVGGPIGDHWEWDGSTWQQFVGATPSARFGATLAFDPQRNRSVLFGGYTATDYVDETWEFDGTSWRLLTPPVKPSARSHAQMTWDPNTRGLLLFGGVEAGPTALDDTWVFTGSTWVQLQPATTPTARVSGALLTDTSRGRCVLAGGGGYTALLPYELWDWDGRDWSLRIGESRLRTQAYAAFDTRRGHVVVLEGNNTNRFVSFTFPTDRIGRGNTPLTTSVARIGEPLNLDVAGATASLLMLAWAAPLSPPLQLSGGPFCGNELLFVPPGAVVSVPFQGPRLTLTVPNDAALAYSPILAQAAVAATNCVSLSDAVALRVQPR